MQRRPRRLYLILAAVTLMVAGILAYWFIASAYTGPGAIKIVRYLLPVLSGQ